MRNLSEDDRSDGDSDSQGVSNDDHYGSEEQYLDTKDTEDVNIELQSEVDSQGSDFKPERFC